MRWPVKRQTMITLAKPSIAVEPEADQRDRRRDEAGRDRHGALDGHPREAQPRQRRARAGQPPVGRLIDARRGGRGRQRREVEALKAHAARPPRRRARPATARVTAAGQAVQDHLAVAAACGEPERAQRARVVGDEVLRALGDPGEVADTRSSSTPASAAATVRRVGSASARAWSARRAARFWVQPLEAQALGLLEVEAEEVAAVVGHAHHPNVHCDVARCLDQRFVQLDVGQPHRLGARAGQCHGRDVVGVDPREACCPPGAEAADHVDHRACPAKRCAVAAARLDWKPSLQISIKRESPRVSSVSVRAGEDRGATRARCGPRHGRGE